MVTAGIREARQNLSKLLERLEECGEIVITDRGRPVARLVPYQALSREPFPDLSDIRRKMPKLRETVSSAVIEDREDRI